MTIIANIYVYILDDKFGIQNPQIMAIGKLMNRGCERESMRVQGHKNESKKKRQAAATKIPRSNGGKGPSSTVSPFDIWTNPFPTQKPNTVIFFPSSSSRPKSLKSLKWRV